MHNAAKIIVLNYHLLSDHAGSVSGLFDVSLKAFRSQINVLLERGIPVVSLDALINGTFAGKCGVVLTFDDGNVSDFDSAYPALKELNLTATFFPVVNNIDKAGYVTWQQLSEIASGNFTIGSHGLSHCLLTKLSTSERQHELGWSKTIIEQVIGKRVTYFASPYGWYSKAIVALAKDAGYRALMTTTLKVNFPDTKPFLVHRWNIRQNTSLNTFKQMLNSNGCISAVISWASACRQYVKGF
jgi:peptidoglycan/xylan/chitin deacetylase (PgdA/CDA1 family)